MAVLAEAKITPATADAQVILTPGESQLRGWLQARKSNLTIISMG